MSKARYKVFRFLWLYEKNTKLKTLEKMSYLKIKTYNHFISLPMDTYVQNLIHKIRFRIRTKNRNEPRVACDIFIGSDKKYVNISTICIFF